MSRVRRARAFTLIEMMITVVIVGVLAVVATVGYRLWVRTSYMAEAQDMVANIRAAEESFKAENGGYLNVSTAFDPPNMYPATTPGRFKTAWGGDCTACTQTNSWSLLAVQPSGPVIFGYAVVADNHTVNAASATLTPPTMTVNGVNVSTTALTNSKTPWYAVEAVGDLDGNGAPYTTLYALSTNNAPMISNEGQ
jgi:prepilin-type N-terminal cleavage/methylation domain-containing protein